MNMRVCLTLLATGVVAALQATDDSSSIIFDDTKIHRYDLQFYYSDWEDSLTYYKSLPDEEYIPARLVYHTGETDSVVLDSVGVRYKGNSSYAFAGKSPKKPFKFSFDKYSDDRRFFGVKKLNFSNGAKDPTMMREKISYDILARFMPAPRAAFATISIDGNLIGLFTQVEQVDKTFLDAHFEKKSGSLFKSSDNGSTLLYRDANQSSYDDEYELKTNESDNDWSSFIKMLYYVNTIDNSVFSAKAGSVIDLDNTCRYLAFNMVFSNFDSYTGSGRNFYLYDDPSTGRFTLIPWDLNLSFGGFSNSWNVTTNDVVAIANLAERPLNRRIIENDSLRQVYLGYIRSMLDGPAAADSIALRASVIRQLIDSTVQCDSNKLHSYSDFITNIDTSVWVTDGFARSSIPGLRSFCTRRAEALRTQLDTYAAPVRYVRGSPVPSGVPVCHMVVRGGTLTLTYTLSGGSSSVSIAIVTAAGRLIRSMDIGKQLAGKHEASIPAASLGSGYFLLRMTTDTGGTVSQAVIPFLLHQ